MQAAPTLEETFYLLELAEETDFIAGVVGWVDLEKKTAISNIEQLSEHSFFLGIRPMIQDIADPEWMLLPELQLIYDKLTDLGLTFDALIKPQHIQNLHALLRRHPNLKVVIDHGAKPEIFNNSFQPWADNISLIASDTNAYCKLSGLLTETGDNPSYEVIEPYMQHLLDSFGAKRLMWGSDWPVVNMSSNYRSWYNMVDRFIQSLGVDEQIRILGHNAQTFYSL